MTTTSVRTAWIAGAGRDRFDLAEANRNRAAGRDGWDEEPRIIRGIVDRFVDVVGRAVAGLDSGGRRSTETAVGTVYGTARVGEVMHEQLTTAGPRWLSPEMFLHYSPHSVVSAAALAHGLGGAATTVVGRNGGVEAIRHGLRRVAGGVETVLVSTFEAPTLFAEATLGRLGVRYRPGEGEAAAVLLGGRAQDTHRRVRLHRVAAGLPDTIDRDRVAHIEIGTADNPDAARATFGEPAVAAEVSAVAALSDAAGRDGTTVVVIGRPGAFDLLEVS